MPADLAATAKKPSVALKFVELVFAIISIGCVIDGYYIADSMPKIATIYGTQIGFIMVSLVVIMSFFMDTPLHKNILVIVSAVGCIMWLTAGALLVDAYVSTQILGVTIRLADRLVVSGAFALANAVVYLVDAGLTLKG